MSDTGGSRHLLMAGLLVVVLASGCGTRSGRPQADPAAAAAPAPAGAVAAPAVPGQPVPDGANPSASPTVPGVGPAAPAGARASGGTASAHPASASGPGAPATGGAAAGDTARSRAATKPTASGSPAPLPGTPTPGPPSDGPPSGSAGPRSDVVVGSVGTISGVAGEILAGYVRGTQVWVRSVNDRGGVNGHKVRLVVGDDGGDPSRHLALLQQFKERDHVIAFIAKSEPFAGPSVNDWHRKNRMPVIGPDPGAQYAYANPMYFPTTSVGDGQFAGALSALAAVALPQGRTKLGIVRCAESEACAVMDRVWTAQAKGLGFDVVYRAQASIAQPDYTAECLGARNGGAQVLGLALDINSIGRFTTACRRQGYEPNIGSVAAILIAGSQKEPTLEGSVFGATTWAWFAGDNPARREFLDALGRYQAGTEPLPLNAMGWLAGKVLEEAARHLPEPPTTDALLDGLYSIANNDFGGLTYPLTYRRDAPFPPRTCWTTVVIRNGQYTAPFGVDLTCTPGR